MNTTGAKRIDPEKKKVTHVIFREELDENVIRDHAYPIQDVGITATLFPDDRSLIKVYHTILDKEFVTNKIRMVTSIEVSKFINGTFDPFKPMPQHGEENGVY